jgi:prolyl-tRNA synthetase
MRGREFVMKDGYSFHTSYEDCRREYEAMRGAYSRIFRRCGLEFRAVEADTGAIGGSMSHEFQVLAGSGEDLILSCDRCDYAANVEKACSQLEATAAFAEGDLEDVSTPGIATIEDVSAFLKEPAARFIKTLIYVADGRGIAALVRGDDSVSDTKLKAAVGGNALRMAEEAEILTHTGGPQGFSGPVGLRVEIVADESLRGAVGMVTGANRRDMHLRGVSQTRDFSSARFVDLRTARAGERCPRCEGKLEAHRGIEVGQVFYLGDKYSRKLGAVFLDPEGREQVIEMGTYGIGVTRTMAAAIEQNHDDGGICWPVAIAPYEALVVPVKMDDAATCAAAESVYEALVAAGVDVLIDDRDERAGVKFNDADLIGVPYRITLGPRGVAKGMAEVKQRRGGETVEVEIARAAEHVAAAVAAARSV